MDVRVFPFAFPPIKGGAQGGDSPTPTPPPVVTYYDLEDAALTANISTTGGDWVTATGGSGRAAQLKIEGIAPMDVTDVASLEFISGFSSLTADGVELVEDTDFSRIVATDVLTGAAVAATSAGPFNRGIMGTSDWNTKLAGKAAGGQVFVTMNAYDSNGNKLQTKTWTAVVE